MKDYRDIIDAPRYIAAGHPGMTVADRAAQFSAFAALTGFDSVIRETGRLTQDWAEQDDGVKLAINTTLCELMEVLDTRPTVQLCWFCPDQRKSGGAYVRFTGNLKKIDTYQRMLVFTDGTQIPIDRLFDLRMGSD